METAWGLGINPALTRVHHNPEEGILFVLDPDKGRRSVTSSRDALNGYQKGRCFYCFSQIKLGGDSPPEVDHFFPQVLKNGPLGDNVDGVWNLVLACQACNRGEGGKHARVPETSLLSRLNTRNEFLISSHHPLRETLIGQTGISAVARRDFLNSAFDEALRVLVHTWNTTPKGPDPF